MTKIKGGITRGATISLILLAAACPKPEETIREFPVFACTVTEDPKYLKGKLSVDYQVRTHLGPITRKSTEVIDFAVYFSGAVQEPTARMRYVVGEKLDSLTGIEVLVPTNSDFTCRYIPSRDY